MAESASELRLMLGDCLDRLRELEDCSVDSVVTDPPYGLSFMGKRWDYDVPSVEVWVECLRVLKPGGHLLAFAGTRTQHRMAVRIEDAGFEIRDMIAWVYGQGFPKSQNIHKSLIKLCKCGNMEADDKTRNNQREASEQKAKHGVRSMQDSDIQEAIDTGEKYGQVLQQSLQEQGSHGSVLREKPEKSTEDGEEPSMEGRGDLQATEGELRGGEVCKMPEGVLRNGEEGRLHNGTSPSNGSEHGKTFSTDGGSPSRGSQPEQQQDRKPCPFCDEWGTQAIRRAASETQGWGTALKPALEPITVARKPLGEKTVAANVLAHGTGGINVDGCRVGTDDLSAQWDRAWNQDGTFGNGKRASQGKQSLGRWPANLIHDGSDEVVGLFPESTSGARKAGFSNKDKGYKASSYEMRVQWDKDIPAEKGSAARFFYCAKASKKDRDEGCDHLPEHQEGLQLPRGKCPDCGTWKNSGELKCKCGGEWQMTSNPPPKARNNHPTVKPTALMRYLCRLVTPPEGIVLDPFMGSGSTGKAAMLEGFHFVGIERDPEYFKIATSRIAVASPRQLQIANVLDGWNQIA